MADNITSPLANGTLFASDDIGGVHYPRTKISFGADGAAADVSAASPFPVTAAISNIVTTVPTMSSGGNIGLTTNATGTTYTAFASQALKQLTLVNNTGTTIEFRQGASGIAIPVFDKTAFTIFGITNANQIDVRRTDTSNTTVSVQARWES